MSNEIETCAFLLHFYLVKEKVSSLTFEECCAWLNKLPSGKLTYSGQIVTILVQERVLQSLGNLNLQFVKYLFSALNGCVLCSFAMNSCCIVGKKQNLWVNIALLNWRLNYCLGQQHIMVPKYIWEWLGALKTYTIDVALLMGYKRWLHQILCLVSFFIG